VNIISKYGIMEFKHGYPENGRTMLEGIITNYPKRMDIWAIYMDMESKYSGENKQQARHLFERCLTNDFILKKPKKMKLVFQKYMEFEMQNGNKKAVEKIRQRVEEYLEKAFKKNEAASDSGEDTE
jgi:rRNA biogenesis protein RRP5